VARTPCSDAIEGTEETPFLTSDEALRLPERPDHLVVVGGGYIAVELSHFFTRMGAEVTIVGHGAVLLEREDEDVARRLTAAYRETCDLHLGYRATEIADEDGERTVRAESEAGEELEVRGDRLLLATGRRPNSDRWNVSAAGIETDEKGFVETDEYLETSIDGVYAIGDIAGNYMFKHSGDKEAEHVVETIVHGERSAVEYPGMAHAIFGSPQVGSLGKTEAELEDDVEYEVGTRAYDETAYGTVLDHDDGFAKVLVGEGGDVLGCHVVGPEASTLIHEVSTAVAAGADAETSPRPSTSTRRSPRSSRVRSGTWSTSRRRVSESDRGGERLAALVTSRGVAARHDAPVGTSGTSDDPPGVVSASPRHT